MYRKEHTYSEVEVITYAYLFLSVGSGLLFKLYLTNFPLFKQYLM